MSSVAPTREEETYWIAHVPTYLRVYSGALLGEAARSELITNRFEANRQAGFDHLAEGRRAASTDACPDHLLIPHSSCFDC